MEETSLNCVEPLQNGEDSTFHNPNIPSSKAVDRQPAAALGNEENAPENSVEARKRHLPRFRVFKKMRLGRSPRKQKQGRASTTSRMSTGSKRRDTNSATKSTLATKPTIATKPVRLSAGKQLLFDPETDNQLFIPPPPSDDHYAAISVLPTLEKAPSSESATSSNSRNWLDDFGKQNMGNLAESRQSQGGSSMMRAPDKDPRFHCKRKAQPQPQLQFHDRGATENAHPGSPVVFPTDAMEDSQVFLAPVIVPPSSLNGSGRRSSWKQAPAQQPRATASPVQKRSSVFETCHASIAAAQDVPEPGRAVASPVQQQRSSAFETCHAAIAAAQEAPMLAPTVASPMQQRSSVFETSHDAIAAAQEAPELAASTSQETSSSESNSATLSALTSSTTSSMASALVKRLVVSSATKDTTKARLHRQTTRTTPLRIKPRVKPQEVQATDQGYASVAKLSAWLADDPTSTKKVRHVRRGANVIAKSRQFEKDLEDIIVEENNISSGAVKEKKDWLKSAFVHEDEGEEEDDFFQDDPNRHMMMMRTRPVNFDDGCARSEFVVKDDGASAISVGDKKKWLANAFKKEDESGSTQKRVSYKAQSDVGPLRESRDDITSRAKNMWKQKSERRVPGGPSSAQKPAAAPSPYRSNQRPPTAARDATPRKTLEEKMRATLGSRASAPSPTLAKTIASDDRLSSRHTVIGVPLEEDTTPVDFRAARQLLIQRSKNNGNEVNVASKVQRKANKFEKINKDTKRRSSITGLLKPTWEQNVEVGHEEPQGPSDAYTKAFVEDIAPKRSFGELP